MRSTFAQAVLASVLLGHSLAAVHRWPNPALDALEHQRWDQKGFNANGLVAFVTPCDQFAFSIPSQSGHRTNAADWLRTAYHDMANADIQTGIGGLDASIQFSGEQSRPENAGDSFNNTIAVVRSIANRHISLADAIALGAVVAIEQCGGPEIPFRGGRVDAKEAGPPGVPEPEQDLASHTASFARQGFSAEEMIQLIACGHSIGGVQRKFFPNIVPESDADPQTNPEGNTHFDSTFDFFDNTIATEYVSGTTKNPLVTGFNVTTRSDMRIFSSDGNVTMKAFAASNNLFLSTCASVFERMLNTVPHGVQLTDLIEPLPAKPHQLTLMRNPQGNFILQGEFRLWNMQESDDLQVNFSWTGEDGKACADCSTQLSHIEIMVSVTAPGHQTALWFSLPDEGLLIDGSSSISQFWLDINQGGTSRKEDQNGLGFPLQTNLLVSTSTCAIVVDEFNLIGMRVDVAVKKGQAVTAVWVEADGFDEIGRNIPQAVSTFVAQLNQTASATDAHYDTYSVTITDQAVLGASSMNVAGTIGGNTVRDWTVFRLGQTGFGNC